jgi:hypothetical protein
MIEIRCACGCLYRVDESRIGSLAKCPNLSCGIVLRVDRQDIIPAEQTPPMNVSVDELLREAAKKESPIINSPVFSRDTKIALSIAAILTVILSLYWLISWASRQPDTAPATANTSMEEPKAASSDNPPPYIKSVPPSTVPEVNLAKIKKPEPLEKIPEIKPLAPLRLPPIRTHESNAPSKPLVLIPSCAIGHSPERPESGERIEPDNGTSGEATLEINNGLTVDAVVRLVDSSTNTTSRFVYVRANSVYKIVGIEPSEYFLRYMTGSDWIPNCVEFQKDEDIDEFEKTFVFEQSRID